MRNDFRRKRRRLAPADLELDLAFGLVPVVRVDRVAGSIHPVVPVEAEILGELEPRLNQTLETIRQRGQVTLMDLRETSAETKATWSNRIASLIRQGFVVPSPEPNKRVYRFVLA